jgi:predicted RNase H-like HicB family nuclease
MSGHAGPGPDAARRRLADAVRLPYTTDGIFGVKTYAFRVVVEPDEGGFHAYCPALRRFGAVTQGATAEEALKNINEVVQIIVYELRENGIALPAAQELEDPRSTTHRPLVGAVLQAVGRKHQIARSQGWH